MVIGSGTFNAKVAAGFGSTVEATGQLSLGDDGALDGFFSDGVLVIGPNMVTLEDANEAVLGSATTMTGGNLVAENGILLEFGKNLSGHGAVSTSAGRFENNGDVYGGTGGSSLEFRDMVTGVGDYFQTVQFSGGFSPGLSPVEVHMDSVIFGPENTLSIELGGLTPGSEHDKLIVDGDLTLDGIL